MRIYYYVSGHGFGHISRTSVILEKLILQPEIDQIHLISSRIDFIKWNHAKLIKRNQVLDTGVFQKDSLSLDVKKTKEALQSFEKEKNFLLKLESDYCTKHNIDLIITDAGSFPITLAIEVGIPSIFIGNFTWDFIYQNYGEEDPYFAIISDLIRTEYTFATEALFLPFTCPMPSFLESTAVGMVGRKPTMSKSEARKLYGFSDDIIYILLSFGAYGLKGFEMDWKNLPSHIRLVASGVPGIDSRNVIIPADGYYPDLVKACDYVLTKPGYGILSETFYAKTPVMYTDRGNFSEYPVLVDILQTKIPSAYIAHSQISNCQFEESIAEIKRRQSINMPFDFESDGELKIIQHILEYQ